MVQEFPKEDMVGGKEDGMGFRTCRGGELTISGEQNMSIH